MFTIYGAYLNKKRIGATQIYGRNDHNLIRNDFYNQLVNNKIEFKELVPGEKFFELRGNKYYWFFISRRFIKAPLSKIAEFINHIKSNIDGLEFR